VAVICPLPAKNISKRSAASAFLITAHKTSPKKEGVWKEREIHVQLIQTLLYPSIQMLKRFNKGRAAM